MTRPDPFPHLAAVALSHGDPDQPGATFRALDAAMGQAIGHILFTILIHHPGLMENERFYTNMPDAYPVGGRKKAGNFPLRARLIEKGEPYIGRNAADIEWAFFDHALIRSLGCESVLNMPVRWRGQTLGTLNLLHRAGWYDEADIPTAKLFAQLAVPAMALIART